jgi:hypothetical protein
VRYGRRRFGLGDATAEFQALMRSGPAFPAAWGQVQAHLTAEGLDPSSIDPAVGTYITQTQDMFANSFNGLGALAQDAGVDMASQGLDALSATTGVVISGRTLSGAITNVQGLIQGATSGNTAQIVQSVTGVMLAVGLSVAPITAGLGAAVMAGGAAVLSLLSQAGLFGSTPPGLEIVPGCFYWPSKPAFTLSHVVAIAADPTSAQVAPGTSNWRPFPEPGPDPAWFWLPGNQLTWGWDKPANGRQFDKGVSFLACTPQDSNDPSFGWRMIDLAFPEYRFLECEQQLVARGKATPHNRFAKAFFAAWKANKEFALNGLNPQTDGTVLAHALRIYNRAHDGAIKVPLPNSGYGAPLFQGPCPSTLNYYYSYLVKDAISTGLVSADTNGNLMLNAGGLKAENGALATTSTNASAAAGMSTGGKVAVGAALIGGATAAGIGVYAAMNHISYKVAAQRLWGKLF